MIRWIGSFFSTLALTSCLVGVSQPGQAQITPSKTGYVFRAKYTKGQKMSYVMEMKQNIPGLPGGGSQAMTSPLTMEVVSTEGKGATMKTTSGPTMMNGKQFMPVQTQEARVDEFGKTSGGNATGMTGMQTGMPPKPLKIGGSYTQSQTMNMQGMQMVAKTTFTLKEIKKVGKRQVVVLSIVSATNGSAITKGTGMVSMDMADGSLVDMQVTQSGEVKQGAQSIKIKSFMSMKRK